jgi:hypothetical protein
MAQQMFSLIELKSMARSQLKPGSTVREMILCEPDELPSDIARVKAEMYLTLWAQERAKH